MDDNKKTVVIDLTEVDTREGLHDLLEGALDLPDHYGRNWDALHDMLTGFIPPLHLQIYGAYETCDDIKEILPIFAKILSVSASEYDGFSYEFIEDVEEE